MLTETDLQGLTPEQVAKVKSIVLTDDQVKVIESAVPEGPARDKAMATALYAKQLRACIAIRNRKKFRVSPGQKEGIICVYGLGQRYPVSLRKDAWETIFANQDEIRKAYS